MDKPTIEPGYKYYRRGPQWARVRMGIMEYRKPDDSRWVLVALQDHPYEPGWKEWTTEDQLHENLRETEGLAAGLARQVAEQRATIQRLRAKNSALRKEKWEASGGVRKDEKPKQRPEVRRFYHSQDGFLDGVQYFELREDGAYSFGVAGLRREGYRGILDHAEVYVEHGTWIEVRGGYIPASLPKPPPVPKGYTHWEYHPHGWVTSAPVRYTFRSASPVWLPHSYDTPSGVSDHYLEAKGLKTVVRAGTAEDKLAGYDVAEVKKAIEAAAPKPRIFRHVTGFKDNTDYVELSGDVVTLVQKDGVRVRAYAWLPEDVDKQVRAGRWYEVKGVPFKVDFSKAPAASPFKANIQKVAEVVRAEMDAHRQITIQAALCAKFGYLPSLAVCRKHLHRVIDVNRVEHWLWLDKPLALGEKAPLNKAICRINPPSFTPNQES